MKILSAIFSHPEKLSQKKRIAIFFSTYLSVFILAALSVLFILTVFGQASWAFILALLVIIFWLHTATKVFVDGGTWAATVSAKTGSVPDNEASLRSRLLEINAMDLPFHVRSNKKGDLIAEWKIVDAHWAEILQKNGLDRQYQVVMRLDNSIKRVRTVDIDKSISWVSGIGRTGFSLSYFRGINLWQYDYGVEIGLIYKDGSWGIKPAYNYQFILSEIKNPLIDCITSSGWTFCPVLFFGGPLALK